MRVQVEEAAHEARPSWFVVECRHQREKTAKANLVGQGFEVYLPMRFCLRKDSIGCRRRRSCRATCSSASTP
jgi:hypothetical protein